jgi:hypothetical protein
MHVIVPLAGPDFISSDGTLKAEFSFKSEPLLRRVLNTRPWASEIEPQDYTFIFQDVPQTRAFAAGALSEWYPGATVAFLSKFTRGAALSALAGMSMISDLEKPIIVDLADIYYESSLVPQEVFAANEFCGGIALTFKSNNPAYSYLSLDQEGNFVEAMEKCVISNNASAGTYMFRNLSTYVRALSHGLENASSQMYKNLFYVCPLFNGVKSQGKYIILENVSDVIDVKFNNSLNNIL